AARTHTRPCTDASIGTAVPLELQHGDDPLTVYYDSSLLAQAPHHACGRDRHGHRLLQLTTPLGYFSYSLETPMVVAATRAPSVFGLPT
ncbi:hypothetical protein PIB30_085300, partial [Stylosanthes scabra]|nr:hypothetical protein [Stylosanthes scabra]